MIQAARSGKQNSVEGSQASGTSKDTEIKLTGVARASFQELLEDYRDFLRTRGVEQWDKNNRQARFVRRLGATPETTCAAYEPYVKTRPREVVANILICLIHQTNYLLDWQLEHLQIAFLKEGGLRERMTRPRMAERQNRRGTERRRQ
jgi:four helix bundle suffix protein